MRYAIFLGLGFVVWVGLGACGGNVVVDRGAGAGAEVGGTCSCSAMCSVLGACGESALCNCAAYSDATRACLCKLTPGDCVAERACLGVHGQGGGTPTTTTSTTTGAGAAGGSGQGGASAGGHAPTGTYGAVALYTDVERVVLFESDPARDVCVRVQLAYLGGSPQGGLQVSPDGWAVERIEALEGAGACAACYPPQGGFAATDAKGTIALDGPAGGQGMPTAVSANMNALFTGAPAWAPFSVDLVTEPVAIEGCLP